MFFIAFEFDKPKNRLFHRYVVNTMTVDFFQNGYISMAVLENFSRPIVFASDYQERTALSVYEKCANIHTPTKFHLG